MVQSQAGWSVRRWLIALAATLALSVNVACGWPPPPETVSIDSAFSAPERAAILDGIDQWCTSVEWCPRVIERGADARYAVSIEMSDGRTKLIGGKPVVLLNASAVVGELGIGSFWRVAAHESGHLGIEAHVDSSPLMGEPLYLPSADPLCIDDRAARQWCREQACAFTRGTCGN